MQVTDIHIDIKYEPGSIANCKETMCCRADSIPRDSNNNIAAGFWGSSNKCDVPIWLVENMFQNIADNEEVRISFINNHFSFITFSISKFDIIFWTGDISAHNIWNNTKEDAIYTQCLGRCFVPCVYARFLSDNGETNNNMCDKKGWSIR